MDIKVKIAIGSIIFIIISLGTHAEITDEMIQDIARASGKEIGQTKVSDYHHDKINYFTYKSFPLGSEPLSGLTPITGAGIPSSNQYAGGTLVVGKPFEKVGLTPNGERYYHVTLYGKNPNGGPANGRGSVIPGGFILPESALSQIGINVVAKQGSAITSALSNPATGKYNPCAGLGGVSQIAYNQALKKQISKRRPSVLPEERFERETRSSNSSPRRDNVGNAPFASGRTTAVGDGTGLINMREDDPNADRQTPGCEPLAASPEEREQNSSLEMTEESLSTCINAIQDYILQDITPPAVSDDRETVFSRMFELPNHEQEFMASIFTLTGEVGDLSNDRPMEGIMVLKVLSNRRNNANQVEDAISACNEKGLEGSARADCYAEANSESVYNLLDIALDDQQFSMYNSGDGDNWVNNLGQKRSTQFNTAINTFLQYSKMESFDIQGGNGNAEIDKVYHYHTPGVYPEWRNDNLKLRISGKDENGSLAFTESHFFYYNHDNKGRTNGDGWYRNINHDFRKFP